MAEAHEMILSYILFMGFLTLIIGFGAPQLLDNVPPAPIMPTEAPGALEYLGFTLSNIGYFIVLLGVTSVTYPWLGTIIFAINIAFLYIILRLVRGGG